MTNELRAETAANLVLTLRHELCATQREFAAKARVERAVVARIELGREAKFSTLRRLIASFGGRLELYARFERPMEALAEDFLPERDRRFNRLQDERRARRRFKAAFPIERDECPATPPATAPGLARCT